MNRYDDLLTSAEAARYLGIKRATLYTYVSRHGLRSVPGRRHRQRLYPRADLDRIKARNEARTGRVAAAAGALRWGAPVIDTELSTIRATGPVYRGHHALELAQDRVSFESVADALWTGEWSPTRPRWPRDPAAGLDPLGLRDMLPDDVTPRALLSVAVPALAACDPVPFGAPLEEELRRSRSLIRTLASLVGLAHSDARYERALAASTIADVLARALGRRERKAVDAIEAALVVCADHELNVSSFAARVVASAQSSLLASVGAGLAALSGGLHGGVSERVEALVDEIGAPRRASAVVQARLARGQHVPGFGHRLYPRGDPRGAFLLRLATRLGPRNERVRILGALVRAMERAGRPPPNLDIGLTALVSTVSLRPGATFAVFAVGRCAGWIAHALEERRRGRIIRPRARYVGERAD